MLQVRGLPLWIKFVILALSYESLYYVRWKSEGSLTSICANVVSSLAPKLERGQVPDLGIFPHEKLGMVSASAFERQQHHFARSS
jgi:hypothetical protein